MAFFNNPKKSEDVQKMQKTSVFIGFSCPAAYKQGYCHPGVTLGVTLALAKGVTPMPLTDTAIRNAKPQKKPLRAVVVYHGERQSIVLGASQAGAGFE